MANERIQILLDAIARNCAMVLSLPSTGMLRHHKSRFLAEEDGGFWIESTPGDRLLIDALIEEQKSVGISFRTGGQKVSFITPILQRELQFRVNQGTVLEAARLAFPTEVRAIQRRNNYRVRVPEDEELYVRVWRIPEQLALADKPMASAELPVKLRDVSTGGLGVAFLPKDGEPAKVLAGERLRVALRYQDSNEIILEGRVCYLPPSKDEPVRAGIQFKKLEDDLEGRQKLAALTGIVGKLQRDEVRRTRLGIQAA